MNRWTNISGILIVDAGIDEEGNWYLENQKELPDDVIKELLELFPKEEEELKIKIHFLSTGSYTPAITNGSWAMTSLVEESGGTGM